MSKRTSLVQNIEVKGLSSSAVFEIGDSENIQASSKTFAVQREHELYFTHEGDFADYPIFTQDIPKPLMKERLNIHRYNESSYIKVNNIDINGVSTAGVLQIGSTSNIENESRVKHIRQLRDRRAT